MQQTCKHFGTCGGCDSQDIVYAEQLRIKEARVNDIFSPFSVRDMRPIVPSPQIFYYRNKMEYAVNSDADKVVIGLRQKKRYYRTVDLEECKIFFEDL